MVPLVFFESNNYKVTGNNSLVWVKDKAMSPSSALSYKLKATYPTHERR